MRSFEIHLWPYAMLRRHALCLRSVTGIWYPVVVQTSKRQCMQADSLKAAWKALPIECLPKEGLSARDESRSALWCLYYVLID